MRILALLYFVLAFGTGAYSNESCMEFYRSYDYRDREFELPRLSPPHTIAINQSDITPIGWSPAGDIFAWAQTEQSNDSWGRALTIKNMATDEILYYGSGHTNEELVRLLCAHQIKPFQDQPTLERFPIKVNDEILNVRVKINSEDRSYIDYGSNIIDADLIMTSNKHKTKKIASYPRDRRFRAAVSPMGYFANEDRSIIAIVTEVRGVSGFESEVEYYYYINGTSLLDGFPD